MAKFAFRRGQSVRIGPNEFLLLRRLPGAKWQIEDTATGEWITFRERELLNLFANQELTFLSKVDAHCADASKLTARLERDLSTFSPQLVALAQTRLQYLKEIDRHYPIAITQRTLDPLIRSLSEQICDAAPPHWRTVCRDYRKWLSAGRDVRAIIFRYEDRGNRASRIPPEVKAISDQVIAELYMTPERKRVPEVHLEIVRRVADQNRFRVDAPLPIPSQRTIYREIERRSPYELMVARYGKRRAEMEFRDSGAGPGTSRALQRVSMDHTPSDLIVVDDDTMLPLGRPTITSALDEYTRCPMGFYAGFEPPSCLSVMRCLKHAILPKTYVSREFPSIKNVWECYGVPELLVVDNPPEFHSTHFERACLQIGIDIQFTKVLVPWYKGKLERFQGTMNHDLLHGTPGTTFSNILERDDYDPMRHAVVMLSTFREMLHKWIIDVYLQTPHRGIKDTPAHRWRSDMNTLPPPLPADARELDVVLGMTTRRTAFHYGVELEGLKYNGPELGELRRRVGLGVKVELTFDPGNLGHVHILDPQTGIYFHVPAVDKAYANGLSLWQHRVIRHYAWRQLNARTDIVALAQAKAEIRALVERDFSRKSTHGRKRHARFLQNHSSEVQPNANQLTRNGNLEVLPIPISCSSEDGLLPAKTATALNLVPSQSNAFSDDDVLPVFEASFDLLSIPAESSDTSEMHNPNDRIK